VFRAIAMCSILLTMLTGCGGSDDNQSSAKPPDSGTSSSEGTSDGQTEPGTILCFGKSCSHQEVAQSGCDQESTTVKGTLFAVKPAKVAGVAGNLELRTSGSVRCKGIYWARFRPSATTTSPWVVAIRVKGDPASEDQASDAGPTVDGYTEGIYATSGKKITFCLGNGEQSICRSRKAA
jgi:hypothetical protein